MNTIKILLVDDNVLIRSSFKQLLSCLPNLDIIGECSDGSEVLPFLFVNDVDVIFMDINMKFIDGYVATEMVKTNYPQIRVIGFSSDNEMSSIRRMADSGADGFINKASASIEIVASELRRIINYT